MTQAVWLGVRFRQRLMVVREVAVRVRTPQFVVPLPAVGDDDRRVGIKKKFNLFYSLFMSPLSS